MDETTKQIPLQGNAYTFTESVRETAILALAFAEEFERLLENYNINEYDVYVSCKMFALQHSNRGKKTEPLVDDKPEEKAKENFFSLNEPGTFV